MEDEGTGAAAGAGIGAAAGSGIITYYSGVDA